MKTRIFENPVKFAQSVKIKVDGEYVSLLELLQNADIELDETPTSGSDKAVSSGGVYSALQEKQGQISITKNDDGSVDITIPTDSSSAGGGNKLKTQEPFYVNEEEADLILTLGMFTENIISSTTGISKAYEITLNANDVNGKKIRFYYDETDLTENLGEYGSVHFSIRVNGDITEPAIIYGEYYGGNSGDVRVSIGAFCNLLGPITYYYDIVNGEITETRLYSDTSQAVHRNGSNLRAYFEMNDSYNIIGVGDPDA